LIGRLLVVTHYYSTHRGGVEAVARELAARFARSGMSIEWLASDCDPPPPGLPAGVRCIPAGSWNGFEKAFGIAFPLWTPKAIRALRDAVGRCDAVHLHESIYPGNVLAYLFAKRARKPVIVTQHVGAIPYGPAARVLLWLLNRTLARTVLSGADRVFFISPATQRYFARFCRLRSAALVPNGVDTEIFRPDPARASAERPLLLFVGRFVPRKGIALFVSLAKRLPGADWIAAGDGALRPEDDAPPNLSVLRGRSGADLAALYRSADLLVLPSVGEGFPLVVQEAMACGTPALVSPETAAGAPGAGVYAEPISEEGWRGRIEALIADPESLHASRERVAREARERWSWDSAAAAYARALAEIGASARSSAAAAR
jgi:glycosyltransferase involved in cell wall biosynthesis